MGSKSSSKMNTSGNKFTGMYGMGNKNANTVGISRVYTNYDLQDYTQKKDIGPTGLNNVKNPSTTYSKLEKKIK